MIHASSFNCNISAQLIKEIGQCTANKKIGHMHMKEDNNTFLCFIFTDILGRMKAKGDEAAAVVLFRASLSLFLFTLETLLCRR